MADSSFARRPLIVIVPRFVTVTVSKSTPWLWIPFRAAEISRMRFRVISSPLSAGFLFWAVGFVAILVRFVSIIR